MNLPLVECLREIVGEGNVIVDPAAVKAFVEDWRGAYRGRAVAIVRPASTESVAAVLRACAAGRISVVPQGGNTGMCGGAIPSADGDEVVLAMDRMNRVLEIDSLNDTMTVEAGCVLATIQQSAEAAGRFFPLSMAAEGSCQIGGNLATNAGGTNVLRYGNARDLVLGVEVVLAGGVVWNGLRALRKDNRGYDLKHLFIGSEGTLGVITKAVLKLFPLPAEAMTAMIAFDNPANAVQLLAYIHEKCGGCISAYEIIGRSCLELVCRHVPRTKIPIEREYPWYVLAEFSGTLHASIRPGIEAAIAEAIEGHLVADAVIAQSVAQADSFWRLRESIPDATRAEGTAFRSDISVGMSSIPALITAATSAFESEFIHSKVICFGHVGDGNLHFNALVPPGTAQEDDAMSRMAAVLYDIVESFNGSFSAEHGIGQAKRSELVRYKTGVELDLMRKIKQALDPLGLMNPGKVL